MAGENDQCRWVGIRPTNPPEAIPVTESSPLTSLEVEPAPGSADFPVTLNGEVPHVIVDSGAGGGIEPTEMVMTPFYQAVTVTNTWYEVVNRSDPGWIFFAAVLPGVTTKNTYIGLTIDGGARMPIQVLPRATYIMQNFRCNLADGFGVELHGLRFKTSIIVEVMISWITTLRANCLIGYD